MNILSKLQTKILKGYSFKVESFYVIIIQIYVLINSKKKNY